MSSSPVLKLVQLPIPQPAKPAPTANVPLAAGCLAVCAQVHGIAERLKVEVVPQLATDVLGDHLLAEHVSAGEPRFVGLSLYLWNSERSLHLAREIKRRSPRTEIWIGGPEVGPDNPFLLQQSGWDVAVTGEAEEVFAALAERRMRGESIADLPGVAAREDHGASSFTPSRPAAFELTRYPSPYVCDLLPVEADRSTYVETVRGCKSHCTFCFYPRSSAVLRALDVEQSRSLLVDLRERGAREVVFLDPTFNHRPDFVALLNAIVDVNHDRRLRFFAEVRAEGLTREHADLLAKAGFHKLEIGLQSINQETLARTRRGGRPEQVASVSRELKARGIDLLIDLIVGLPGDARDDVLRGADFLERHGLADCAQVFPLSVLPGTAMRAGAETDGLVFDPAPPYRVLSTPTMTETEIRDTFFEAEGRLGRMLDEFPRPYLVDAALWTDPPDVFHLSIDRADPEALREVARPGAEHVALWIEGGELWPARDRIARVLDMRLDVDPYAMLDVVLAPTRTFPIDLLEWIERRFEAAPQSYASRLLKHRGVDAQHRVCAVQRVGVRWPPDYVEALRAVTPVFRELSPGDALRVSRRLGEDLPAARVVGPFDDSEAAFLRLAREADAECVVFADRVLERRWVLEVLRYREVEPAE